MQNLRTKLPAENKHCRNLAEGFENFWILTKNACFCRRFYLYQNSVAMVDFVLDYLGCPAEKLSGLRF